ncbi:MAG: atpA, partial [Deltaproteobacteria bacterium]|nr:atpA [Deltaproteobacteria bacterium]
RMRLELAQYREMAAFAQFGSDLDKATQMQLARGARLTEILKQAQYQPQPVEQQVVTIFAATNGYVDGFEVGSLGRFETELFSYMKDRHGALLNEIRDKKQITDDLKGRLSAALEEFKGVFKE